MVSYCRHRHAASKKKAGNKIEYFRSHFAMPQSAQTPSNYISKCAKFIPLFKSGGTFSFEACTVKLTQFSSTRWFPDRLRFVIFASKQCQKDVKMPCLNRHKTSPSCCPWKLRYRSTYFWWYIWEKDPSLGTKSNILTKIVYFWAISPDVGVTRTSQGKCCSGFNMRNALVSGFCLFSPAIELTVRCSVNKLNLGSSEKL